MATNEPDGFDRRELSADLGGESVCWLDRVCPECGALTDEAQPRCPRCGHDLHEAA